MTLGTWSLAWQEPTWLWLVPVFPAVIFLLRFATQRRSSLHTLADEHLLPLLVQHAKAMGQRDGLLSIACMCAAIAAAGPYLAQASDVGERHGLDISLVIDISPSMNAADGLPTRLQQAKIAAHDVLSAAGTDRYGVIAFSAHAYTVLPLTTDTALARDVINALDPQLATRKGSALDAALRRAEDMLSDSPRGSRAIVLLSDGERGGTRSDTIAARLVDAGIPIIAIGTGTERGAPVTDDNGQLLEDAGVPVISKLARDELQQLALTTGGAYRDASAGAFSSWIAGQRLRLTAHAAYDVALPGEYRLVAWPLLVCVVLLMWWGRTQLATFASICGVLLVMPWHDSYAAPWDERAALAALQQGDWSTAAERYGDDDSYNAALGRGVIAYKRGDYSTARSEFDAALDHATTPEQRARAHYNLGNAYARDGELAAAEQAYRAALSQQPNYPRAALNLSLVSTEQRRLALAQKKKPGDETHSESKAAPATTAGDAGADTPTSTTPTSAGTPLNNPQQMTGAQTPQPWLPENTRAWLEKRFMQLDQTLGGAESQQPW